MLLKMFQRAALIVLASVAIACDQVATLAEPSPTELLQKASANLAKAKTAHIDGGGSFAISPFSFDFKLTGDTEIPDKSRLTMQMSLLGQTVSVDTVTIGGQTFSRGLVSNDWTQSTANDPQGAILDPLGQADLTAVASIAEVDRPVIDGHKTRHLSYVVDQSKFVDKIKSSPSGATPPLTLSGATGTGEIWIRIDDSQIVRQLVKLSLNVDAGLGIPGASSTTSAGTLGMSFDIKFTHIGEPISPAITAPPTS